MAEVGRHESQNLKNALMIVAALLGAARRFLLAADYWFWRSCALRSGLREEASTARRAAAALTNWRMLRRSPEVAEMKTLGGFMV